MPFFEVESGGSTFFLTGEIGGKVVFLDPENPQKPAGVPGKFWAVPKYLWKFATYVYVMSFTLCLDVLALRNDVN